MPRPNTITPTDRMIGQAIDKLVLAPMLSQPYSTEQIFGMEMMSKIDLCNPAFFIRDNLSSERGRMPNEM